MSELPYRPNVGALLFNRDGLVFVARRADQPQDGPNGGAWQPPQGGLDEGEEPRAAVLRELEEEIGTARAEILAEHGEWLTYDLPPALLGVAWKGRWRGQAQRWFALRFTGADSDIRLDLDPHPEFDAWRWARLEELPGLAVDFKRPVYERLVEIFAPYAAPPGGATLRGSAGEAVIAVIFEVRPAEGRMAHYLDLAAALRPELEGIDGFLSVERFRSLTDPDKLLSLSFWRDEEAVRAWRNRPAHRATQAEGRGGVFADYRLRIAGVIRDYGLTDRDQAPEDSHAAHGP